MILFLDFDDTLFNTKQFNEELALLFGVDDTGNNIFAKTHNEVKESGGGLQSGYYSFPEHADRIARHVGGDYNTVKRAVFDFAKRRTKDFIFDDVPQFLNEHKERHTLHLITLANTADDYQKHKIDNSGIDLYFGEIILTGSKTKAEILKEYIDNNVPREKIVLLDDRGSWLEKAKKENPDLIIIQMRREDGRYHDNDIGNCPHVRNMEEFAKLLATF